MSISEFIAQLQMIKLLHGDIDVFVRGTTLPAPTFEVLPVVDVNRGLVEDTGRKMVQVS